MSIAAYTVAPDPQSSGLMAVDAPVTTRGAPAYVVEATRAEFINHIGRPPTDDELNNWVAARVADGTYSKLAPAPELAPTPPMSILSEALQGLGVSKSTQRGLAVSGATLFGGPTAGVVTRALVPSPSITPGGGQVNLPSTGNPLGDLLRNLGQNPLGNPAVNDILTRLGGSFAPGGPGTSVTTTRSQGGTLGGTGTGGVPGTAGGVVYQPGKGYVWRQTKPAIARTVDRKVHMTANGWQLNKPRMNPLNPHAAARAFHRLDALVGFSKKVLHGFGFHVSGHLKPKSRSGGKRRKGFARIAR